jgi:ribosomal protein S18 acetylase RimI-like enzyme
MIDYATPAPDDAPELAAMARTCFIETFGHLYSAQNLASFLEAVFSPAAIAADIADPDRTICVARDDGRIVGFAKIGPLSLPIDAEAGIDLKQLYVLSGWQGAGIAATLMDWVIDQARARAVATIALTVYVDNIRAQRFYARYGFRDVGRYDFPVGDQIDEDRLWRLDL